LVAGGYPGRDALNSTTCQRPDQPKPIPDKEFAMSNGSNLPQVGTIAGPDDIAPEGEVITEQHVLAYRASVEAAHHAAGMPTADLWSDNS
jgi:hypothetical protein